MKPRKQLGVTHLLLRRFGLWVIDGRFPTGTTRLELPQVGVIPLVEGGVHRLPAASARGVLAPRKRPGSIRRVGLRARNGPGEHLGPPPLGRSLRENRRPPLHRCGYPQGGSKIEDRERTAHSPTRQPDPPLERGVRPGPRISEETRALSDGACLYIGITILETRLFGQNYWGSHNPGSGTPLGRFPVDLEPFTASVLGRACSDPQPGDPDPQPGDPDPQPGDPQPPLDSRSPDHCSGLSP